MVGLIIKVVGLTAPLHKPTPDPLLSRRSLLISRNSPVRRTTAKSPSPSSCLHAPQPSLPPRRLASTHHSQVSLPVVLPPRTTAKSPSPHVIPSKSQPSIKKRMGSLPLMNLVRTRAFPILQQLHLEERLLRTSTHNWCIINDGTDAPTIVMGSSGSPSELIEVESVLKDGIPVVKRFSGGGTVIVDSGTIFMSFICNKGDIPGLQLYPSPIMSWTGQLYGQILSGVGDFRLRENDYAFGSRKVGGNAQSITKDRWIHHTSFLWDYDAKNMEYLKLPSRAPKYRSARHHVEFLCLMKDYLPSRSNFIEKTISSLGNHFSVRPVTLEAIETPSDSEASYPRTTNLLTEEMLEEHLCHRSEVSGSQRL